MYILLQALYIFTRRIIWGMGLQIKRTPKNIEFDKLFIG